MNTKMKLLTEEDVQFIKNELDNTQGIKYSIKQRLHYVEKPYLFEIELMKDFENGDRIIIINSMKDFYENSRKGFLWVLLNGFYADVIAKREEDEIAIAKIVPLHVQVEELTRVFKYCLCNVHTNGKSVSVSHDEYWLPNTYLKYLTWKNTVEGVKFLKERYTYSYT